MKKPLFKQKDDRIEQLYTCKIMYKHSFETLIYCITIECSFSLMPTNYNCNFCFKWAVRATDRKACGAFYNKAKSYDKVEINGLINLDYPAELMACQCYHKPEVDSLFLDRNMNQYIHHINLRRK